MLYKKFKFTGLLDFHLCLHIYCIIKYVKKLTQIHVEEIHF